MHDYAIVAGNGGLGDYLAMSGAIRWLHSRPDRGHTSLACHRARVRNLKFLFRDLTDFNLGVYRHAYPMDYIQNHKRAGKKMHVTLWGGFGQWQSRMRINGIDPENQHWIHGWYKELGVPYRFRYENWHVARDKKREDSVFSRLRLSPDEPYKFVVNNRLGLSFKNRESYNGLNVPFKGRVINPNRVPWNKDTLIFDWMGIIEHANIIETIDTSWMHLVKLMRLKNKDQRKIINSGRPVRCTCRPQDNPNGKDNRNEIYYNDPWDNGWEVM